MKPVRYLAKAAALIALFTIVPLTAWAQQPRAIDYFAVGVPHAMGLKPNFDDMFAQLKGAGITVFMPFSEYQEVPQSKTLTYESEFFPKFKKDDMAINAMRRHGIKLLVPGSILYPDGKMPPISEDPLKQLIAWVGRKNVYAVYSFDEPVLTNMQAQCEALYKRVKEIDSTLPVMMVHAPVSESITTSAGFEKHFAAVRAVSKFSDFVGFDVYAVPKELMKVHGPYSGPGKILDYRGALSEYLLWLKENLPQKKHVMALQAFCLRDQGHPLWLAKLYGDRRPNGEELQDMVKITADANAGVCWWGQSLVKDKDGRFWNQILDATRRFSLSP